MKTERIVFTDENQELEGVDILIKWTATHIDALRQMFWKRLFEKYEPAVISRYCVKCQSRKPDPESPRARATQAKAVQALVPRARVGKVVDARAGAVRSS